MANVFEAEIPGPIGQFIASFKAFPFRCMLQTHFPNIKARETKFDTIVKRVKVNTG